MLSGKLLLSNLLRTFLKKKVSFLFLLLGKPSSRLVNRKAERLRQKSKMGQQQKLFCQYFSTPLHLGTAAAKMNAAPKIPGIREFFPPLRTTGDIGCLVEFGKFFRASREPDLAP